MSAAMRVTEGSARSDFSTDTAAGPPAPVTSTRTGLVTMSCRVMCTSGGSALQGRCGPGRLRDHRLAGRAAGGAAGRQVRAVADHLEGLGIAPFGEPGPVPGSCGDQVGLKVGPHRNLRAEGVDGPHLRVEMRVDADEASRPEIHGGRWRLEAEDPADLARRDYRGPVGVAVILVHVVDRVRVDHGRPHLADHPADDPYGRIALADPGVCQVLEGQPR